MSHPAYVRGKSVDPASFQHLPLTVMDEVSELKTLVFSHPSVKILEAFGEKLRKQKLDRNQIRTLLASEGMFVLEVPPGILALASRITDECFATKPFAATGLAARILFAAVDEYGLNDMQHGLLPSHHQLYLDMAAHWGITGDELSDHRNIVPTAFEFARVICDYYRHRPIVEGLGFHVANESTAPLDFGVFLKTFQSHRGEYGLKAENDPHLNFLLVHDDVEVSHREMGVEMVQLYTEGRPHLLAAARQGVAAYMDCYGRFFAELDEAIFGEGAHKAAACA